MARIIELEGLDCSFKETNAERLREHLSEIYDHVYKFDFPRYSTDLNGNKTMVESFLNGEYNDVFYLTDSCKYNTDIISHIINIFAYDKFQYYHKVIKPIYENNDDNTIIIMDRWSKSNLYQIARLASSMKEPKDSREYRYNSFVIDDMIKKLVYTEYIILKLPRPNLSIFLDTPYYKAKEVRMKKANKDINETDEELQRNVYNLYYRCYYDDLWTRFVPGEKLVPISTLGSNTEFLSKEELGNKVINTVDEFLLGGM